MRGYSSDKFVMEVGRYGLHPIDGSVLVDSYIITFDGNFQVWHNREIVYECYDRDTAIAYANKCLEK